MAQTAPATTGADTMRPVARSPVNKYDSARRFKNSARRTKAANVAPPPMRGGFRL